MRLGVQVRYGADLSDLLKQAKDLGCNTIQFFNHNPRGWKDTTKPTQEEINKFKKETKKLNINPLFIHLPYLLNLATPDDNLYKRSINAFINQIKKAQNLGVEFLVMHLGSHKKSGEKFGLRRIVQALNTILDKTYDSYVNILLENTAGSGSWLGYNFAHHGFILKNIRNKKRIGVCLDTCHAYVSGYDISKKEGLNNLLKEIDEETGLEKLKLIHLNDAKDKCGSRRDRHQDIGKGYIGYSGIKEIINHPFLKDIPFILETPKKTDSDDIRNLNTVRRLFHG
jgi:deoxyribonuclease-4